MNTSKKQDNVIITKHFLERFNERKRDKNKTLDEIIEFVIKSYKENKKNPWKFKGQIYKTQNENWKCFTLRKDFQKIVFTKEDWKLKLISFCENKINYLKKHKYEYW